MAKKKKKSSAPVVQNPVAQQAAALPVPGAKYALKQVYRDPVTRKAFVFFIDANTGQVLTSLDGYNLYEGGVITQPATGTPAAPAAPTQGGSQSQQAPGVEDKYLGRGEDREGTFGGWLGNKGFIGSQQEAPINPNTKGDKQQTVTSTTYPGGQGKINVSEGTGPATKGTYEVNTPSLGNRVAQQVGDQREDGSFLVKDSPISKDLGLGGLSNQQFSQKELSFAFPSDTPASTPTSTSGTPTGGGNLAGYYDKKANEVPQATWEGYIAQEASKRGINPDVAIAIAREEGLNETGYRTSNLQATAPQAYGQERSFGAFQIHAGAAGKNAVHTKAFETATGFKIDDPSVPAEMARIQYGLNLAVTNKGFAQDWVNTSAKPEIKDLIARVGGTFINKPEVLPITVTAEVVAAGFLPGADAVQYQAQSSNASPAPIGLGMVPPEVDSRMPGSGAPAIQPNSMWEQLGGTLPSVQVGYPTDTAFSSRPSYDSLGYSTAPGSLEEGNIEPGGVNAGAFAGPVGNVNNPGSQYSFSNVAPNLSNNRTLSGSLTGSNNASQIGRNPTTGDEFAVAREMERQTAANYSMDPTSSRTLSGPVKDQKPEKGTTNVSTPSRQDITGLGNNAITAPSGVNEPTQGFVDRVPVDFDKVTSQKGNIAMAAEGITTNKNGIMSTRGKTDIVISNVMPNNSGIYIPANEDIQYQYDPKTGMGRAVAKTNDLKAIATVDAVNAVLAANDILMGGPVKGLSGGLIQKSIGALLTGGAKVVNEGQTKSLFERFAPNERITISDYDQAMTDAKAAERQLYDQAAANQALQPMYDESMAAARASERQLYDSARANRQFAEQSALSKSWSSVPAPDYVSDSYADAVGPGRGFSSGGPELAPDRNASRYADYEANRAAGFANGRPTARTDYFNETQDRMAAIGAYDPATGVTNYDRVPNNEERYRDDAFSRPSYMSRTVEKTLNPTTSFYDTPVGEGLPGREKSWKDTITEGLRSITEGFIGGISRTADMVGGFGMGGRQGDRSYDSPSEGRGGPGYGASGRDYSGRGYDAPSESRGGPGSGASARDYSGRGGSDSPSEGRSSGPGGGANSGGGFNTGRGDSGGGNYSGRGGQDSPSEGRSSGPGGGANSGGGFNSGSSGGYTGGGPTGGGGSGSNNSTGVSGYTGGGYNNESSFGGPR